MTTDFEGREPDITPNGDAPLFAASPVWERSRKKKGMFGARKSAAAPMTTPEPTIAREPLAAPIAPETRSFAAEPPVMTLDQPLHAPDPTITNSTLAADEPTLGAPTRHTAAIRTSRKSGPSAALIAGGLAAVALVAVGGWYVMAPRDGVPEMTPGEPTTSQLAAAPSVTPEQPAEVARSTNTLSPRAAGPARAEPRQVAQARVRPAARAPSAAASGTNASAAAVLPDAPQAYTTINPSAAPTQVTPAAPPPVQAAPAPIPETPPVQAPAPPAPPELTIPPSA